METIAAALRRKKALIAKLVRVSEDIQKEVECLESEKEQNMFGSLLRRREELKSEIYLLKFKITTANHNSGLTKMLLNYGEIKEELSFWNKIHSSKSSGSRFLYITSRSGEEGNKIYSAVSKEDISQKISELTDGLAELDTDIQRKNHTTKIP